ncbi:MAG: AAA family ATPase, partial [Desulfobacterales bacterium]|nr:AAA family ATPase [Desulfobacterales bacterium]
TDVDIKVPHDPISMLEEIERYRKTGKRKKRVVNTKNILFIMSGAFFEILEIIKKRMADQGIGFGASVRSRSGSADYLKHVKPEDLIKFGFESEFIGRLPVVTVFEELAEEDLFAILKNPNNPVILSKKLDFKAYGIDVKFDDGALRSMAHLAYEEGTGARGLVSVIEKVLLKFEKKLPSTNIKRLAVTEELVKDPEAALEKMVSALDDSEREQAHERVLREEMESIKEYVKCNQAQLGEKYWMELTESRMDLIAKIYAAGTADINAVMKKIKTCYDQVKKMEDYFYKTHDLNVILDEDAIDVVILQMQSSPASLGDFYKQLTTNFEYGFKLIHDRTGQNKFTITKEALKDPEEFLNALVKKEYTEDGLRGPEEFSEL